MFGTTAETVSEVPDLANLDPALRDRVTFDAAANTFTVVGIISQNEQAALEKCFTAASDRKAMERLRERSQGRKPANGRLQTGSRSAFRG